MESAVPKIGTLESTGSYGKFLVEPLERGYGVTLANALRRVMLSSIQGAAITSARIEKVLHEFSTIPGVKEDTTELLLNLKEINVRVHRNGVVQSDKPRVLKLKVMGPARVTGADVVCPEDVEVVNPEIYLATISDAGAELGIEMTVSINKGYVLGDKHEDLPEAEIGTIALGAAFTPVRKVSFSVEATRVESNTNFERLILEVWTNGTLAPEEAMSSAARHLSQFIALFVNYKRQPGDVMALPALDDEIEDDENVPAIRIEELNFTVRTYNCLKKESILTVRELFRWTDEQLMQIRNFGKVSLDEVHEKLAEHGLTLRSGRPSNAAADGEKENN